MSDNLLLGIGTVIGTIMLVAIALWVATLSCQRSWQTSGMQSEFRLFVGCVIETQPGSWTPATNYRAIQ